MSINTSSCLILRGSTTVDVVAWYVMYLMVTYACSENEGSVVNLDLGQTISRSFHFMIYIHPPESSELWALSVPLCSRIMAYSTI